MRLFRKDKIKKPFFDGQTKLTELPLVLIKKTKSKHLIEFSKEIEEKRKENGRYLIKKFELKYPYFMTGLLIKNKKYFLYCNRGIGFTSQKKDKEVYRTNNKAMAIRIAESYAIHCFTTTDCIVAIVDTHNNGEHTYFQTKSQERLKKDIYFT